MGELESKIQRRCQYALKQGGAFVIKTHGDAYSRVGIPDLIACIPVTPERLQYLLDTKFIKGDAVGLFVGLEVKQLGKIGNVSRAQEIVGKEIKDAGGLWLRIEDSRMVETLVEVLEGEEDVIQ